MTRIFRVILLLCVGAVYGQKLLPSKTPTQVIVHTSYFIGENIGLNGIDRHPDGYLLTVNNSNGALLKVDPMHPDRPAMVNLQQFFPGADGLLIDQKRDRVLVQNKGVNKVFILNCKDHFNSAGVL